MCDPLVSGTVLSVRFLALWLWLASCGSAATRSREPAQDRATTSVDHALPVLATPDASAAQDVAEPPIAASEGTACAEVRVGLDLRALPAGTGTGGIDLFVRGQASDLVGRAPAGLRPEIRTMPGAGVFDAVFRGATEGDAVSRCEQAVAAYLATSPRLPITMEPAASVIAACRACQAR